METDFPTASAGTSQAPSAAVEKSHPASHTEIRTLPDKAVFANVFVPDGQLQHFERLVTEYLEEKTDRNGNARDNKKLLNTIGSIRAAAIQGLWTDSPDLLPASPEKAFWWEVRLRRGRDADVSAVDDFRRLAAMSQCQVSAAVVG